VIRDPRRHGRRHAKRFVDAAKIVEREPARDSGPVVLPLLAKGIREPREAANAHTRAQIAALDDAGADTLSIGSAR
jgi:hypothetical protein